MPLNLPESGHRDRGGGDGGDGDGTVASAAVRAAIEKRGTGLSPADRMGRGAAPRSGRGHGLSPIHTAARQASGERNVTVDRTRTMAGTGKTTRWGPLGRSARLGRARSEPAKTRGFAADRSSRFAFRGRSTRKITSV